MDETSLLVELIKANQRTLDAIETHLATLNGKVYAHAVAIGRIKLVLGAVGSLAVIVLTALAKHFIG